MIVLFHNFFIVTKLLLTTILCKVRRKDGEHKKYVHNSSNSIEFLTASAELEEDIGIKFYPPVYEQRYVAVRNVLQDERWKGKIKKVVDFGCSEFGFFPFLKNLPGLQEVLTVDIDVEMLECKCNRVAPLNADYLDRVQRNDPFNVHILAGSIAETDARLLGCDAVICIELIEHLYPDALEAVPYTVFGFIQPIVAVFTTPNSEFNVLFPNFTGFRHYDHKFEWTREQFEEWASNITTRYPDYGVQYFGIGVGPIGSERYGCCTQMAVFFKKNYHKYLDSSHKISLEDKRNEHKNMYKEVRMYEYPFYVDNRTDDEKILDEATYFIRNLACSPDFDDGENVHIPLKRILPRVEKWCTSLSVLGNILKAAAWDVQEDNQGELVVVYPYYDDDYECSYEEYEDYSMNNEERKADNWDENWDLTASEQEIHCNDMHNTEIDLKGEEGNSCYVQEHNESHSEDKRNQMHDLKDADKSINKQNPIVEDKANTVESTSTQGLCLHSENLDPLSKIDEKCLNELKLEGASEATCNQHDKSQELDRFYCGSAEKCTEALKSNKSNDVSSLSYPVHSGKRYLNCEVSHEDFHCVPLSSKPQTLNANLIYRCTRNCCVPADKTDKLHRQTDEEQTQDDSSSVAAETSVCSSSHPLNFGYASPLTQESSQDQSLVESSSVDEQNDPAVDSGYPNSYSVQDMDMDLTPEQVDEISSESKISCPPSTDSSDDEREREQNHNAFEEDGFLFRFQNELIYADPFDHNVENGDVANNNRDGEGNNAIPEVPPPPQADIHNDVIDQEIIPLLAAVDDFDNDNDVIFPEDVHPFPHWLLHLLGLANQVNGGGDLHIFMPPAGDAMNMLPDEGLGDDDDDDSSSSDSSISIGGSDIDLGSEMEQEEPGEEILVLGDIGGGGEPDTFQGQ